MMTSMRLGGLVMGSQSWTVAEAKAKFSEIIEKAMSEGPQTITRKGRTEAPTQSGPHRLDGVS